jgi:hypothetical protein
MKFLLKKKVFAYTAKDKLRRHKIDPTNISKSLIKFRKDEEHAGKENVLQPSDMRM